MTIEALEIISIVVMLLCWTVLAFLSYKHGITPLDAVVDLIKRIFCRSCNSKKGVKTIDYHLSNLQNR